jgi:hypothetical protein
MAQYKKKPVVIEAMQWTGKNAAEIDDFIGNGDAGDYFHTPGKKIGIHTLEGIMYASIGDFIIKGVNGEFYPCKPDIFEKTYDKL